MPLTSELAQVMIAASQDTARALGIAISTAIVDADGRLFAFARMDGAHWLSIDVSQAKAFTGALLRRDGPELQQVPAATIAALSTLQGRGLMPLGSVTTVREGDRLVASIGCSGGTDEQDAQCAHAARDAFAR
ncbi:MAG TPA: heme-binding protein [Acidimicrobiales bacterium]|nr:heme-binding protein [Acidimicrobiales bacterium]